MGARLGRRWEQALGRSWGRRLGTLPGRRWAQAPPAYPAEQMPPAAARFVPAGLLERRPSGGCRSLSSLSLSFSRRSLMISGLLLAGAALSACSSGSAANVPIASAHRATPAAHGPVGAVVLVKYVSFDPAFVKITAGQAVEWKWEDAPYVDNVTFPGFSSPAQMTGTFFHTFTQPGVYHYRSTLHQRMRATVKVVG